MTTSIIFNPARVLAFINSFYRLPVSSEMKGIGLEKDGELIAGVIYEGTNQHNTWMHVAAVPGAKWMTREYLRNCFDYPFNQLKVDRVSGYVDASNAQARRLNEHLGFTTEAVLRGAAPDGGDVILYVMWRKDCRYVDPL